MSVEHPAAQLRSSLLELRRRATLTVIAFGAVMLARTVSFVVRAWSVSLLGTILSTGEGAGPELMSRLEGADALVDASNVAISITFVATAVVFLRWTHRLVALTRALGAELKWKPSQAVWAFFIPFVSLIRPYQVFSAARTALAVDRVLPPVPRVEPSAQSDYRSTTFVHPAPARDLPAPRIGPWWGAFLVMSFGSRLSTLGGTSTSPDAVIAAYQGDMAVSVGAIAAAALGITVVRGLTALLAERFRRIHESSPESLVEQRILLS